MKIKLMLLIFLFVFRNYVNAQTRYFEFNTDCGHGNWQDTSFIAITDNPDVIASVLLDLQKTPDERRFISGPIDHGDGGFNHNATYWFLWHFIPAQWELAEMAVEVCDGCPYSDLDADTAYWISNIGMFCPWSGKVSREITMPAEIKYESHEETFLVVPNPVTDYAIILNTSAGNNVSLTLYDLTGRTIRKFPVSYHEKLSFAGIHPGTYILRSDQKGNPSIMLIKIADNK